jgi:YbbR domain-containing protein
MPRLLLSFARNWKLKLLAVALAVLLWVVVSAEQVTSTWIPLPVEVQVADPEFQVIAQSVPREVRVRFVGPGREFIDLAVRRPPLLLRIADVSNIAQDFNLTPAMVRVPDGLNVNALEVEPSTIRLQFRQLATREFAVELVTRGPDANGWVLGGPFQVSPARVRVAGPAELIARIDAIRTIPIQIPASEAPFQRNVPLDLSDLQGVELSAQSVLVTGRVERVVERRLTAIPVSVGAGVVIRPTEVDVVIRGPRSAVEAVGPGTFRVVLAIDGIPSQIPPAGVQVPLRVEGLSARVAARLSIDSVRLFPFGSPAPVPLPPLAEEEPEPAPEPEPGPVPGESAEEP